MGKDKIAGNNTIIKYRGSCVMTQLKTHYSVYQHGNDQAKEGWIREGLVPNKVKFCDGLMLSKSRSLDFTKKTDHVDCKRCKNKINRFWEHGLDLPY